MTTPKLKESTATSLIALAALFLAPGLLILSPDGRLFFLAIAGLVSAIVAIFAPSGKKRLISGLALLIALVMAVQAWPEYWTHDEARKKHTSRPFEQKQK